MGPLWSRKYICLPELGIGKPSIQIADNDDFRNDTLTGTDKSHRTNRMYIQHSNLVTTTKNQSRFR